LPPLNRCHQILCAKYGAGGYPALECSSESIDRSLSLSPHSSLTRSDQRDRSRLFFSFSLIYDFPFYTILCLPFSQPMAVLTCPQGKFGKMCPLAASRPPGRLFVHGNSGAAERTVVSVCQCLSVSVSTFQLLYIRTYLRVYAYFACQSLQRPTIYRHERFLA
jgi:hypothetical protein